MSSVLGCIPNQQDLQCGIPRCCTVYFTIFLVCVCLWGEEGERRVLGIEWRLSMGTCIWLLECLYTAVPSPPHTHSPEGPTYKSRGMRGC